MKISPINTKSNINQKRPAFGMAKISPIILNQLKSKEKMAEHIDIVATAKGVIYSLPAAIAAKLALDNKFNDNKIIEEQAISVSQLNEEAVKNLSDEELKIYVRAQDDEGKTVLHKKYDWDLPGYISEIFDHITLASIYSIKDKDGKTAYMAQRTKSLENSIYAVATGGNLDIEDSINLLKTNNMDKNVIRFLEYRMNNKGGGTVNSIIPPDTLVYLLAPDKKMNILYGEEYSKKGKHLNLKQETVATAFITNDTDDSVLSLDASYLPKLRQDLLLDLVQNTLLSGSVQMHKTLFREIHNNKVLKKRVTCEILPQLNILGVSRVALDMFDADMIPIHTYLKLYNQTDEDGNNPIHYAANERSDDLNLYSHIRFISGKFAEKDILKILTMKNSEGKIPMALSVQSFYEICSHFSNANLLINMLKIQDNNGNTPLHNQSSYDENGYNIIGIFLYRLNNNDEELARILSIQNNEGKTAYTKFKEDDDKYNRSETARKLTDKLKEEIIRLATESDLSLEKSYILLKNNNLEPAIQEFLKLQIEQKNK